MRPTDVEISRSLNALSTTLRDQRHETFDPARAERIVTGAMSGEGKLRAASTGPDSGEVLVRDDGTLVATVRRVNGEWSVERKLHAQGSSRALPQPAHAAEEDG